ncbi:17395_t:CDS:2, partial [Gigaspora rosea]
GTLKERQTKPKIEIWASVSQYDIGQLELLLTGKSPSRLMVGKVSCPIYWYQKKDAESLEVKQINWRVYKSLLRTYQKAQGRSLEENTTWSFRIRVFNHLLPTMCQRAKNRLDLYPTTKLWEKEKTLIVKDIWKNLNDKKKGRIGKRPARSELESKANKRRAFWAEKFKDKGEAERAAEAPRESRTHTLRKGSRGIIKKPNSKDNLDTYLKK